MAATHSYLCRDIARHIRFEWEPGSKWVDIYGPGSDVPYTLAISDFFALHVEAEVLARRIQADRGVGADIVKLSERGPLFLVERHD